MPNRIIKESCRSSKNLDRLSDFEERLFWRLITTADDYGRFLACPELVRSACFPLRTVSTERIETSLKSLQVNELIRIYSIDDRSYGVFCKWEKHQGKPRAKNSKYPEMIASAIGCEHLLADVPGGPNTNTNTNTNSDKRGESERRGKRAISDDDKPTDRHFALAMQLGVDLGPEWGKFKNYCKAHDKRYADFEAAFRNWIAKAAEMKGGAYVRNL
jgi:hypothetical protein